MAVAAWLHVSPVIFLLLGAQPFPLSFFDAGPAPVFAAGRSKWHIPMPSVSVGVATECAGLRGGTTVAEGVQEGFGKSVSKVGGIPIVGVPLGPACRKLRTALFTVGWEECQGQAGSHWESKNFQRRT